MHISVHFTVFWPKITLKKAVFLAVNNAILAVIILRGMLMGTPATRKSLSTKQGEY